MAKRKAKRTAGAKGGERLSPMDYLLAFMKSNPDAVYRDAHTAAAKAGHTIFPIMWGRAQVLLGRRKAKARGSAKATPSRAATPASPPARAPRTAAKKRAPAAAEAPKPSAPAPTKATRGRPRSVTAAASSGIVLPISDANDVPKWQGLVEVLNGGGRVALQYDGSNWILISV